MNCSFDIRFWKLFRCSRSPCFRSPYVRWWSEVQPKSAELCRWWRLAAAWPMKSPESWSEFVRLHEAKFIVTKSALCLLWTIEVVHVHGMVHDMHAASVFAQPSRECAGSWTARIGTDYPSARRFDSPHWAVSRQHVSAIILTVGLWRFLLFFF